jgi:exosome complex component RRP4
MDLIPSNNTHRVGDKIFASRVGLLEVKGRILRVIPLSGRYMPKKDDIVIGVIDDIGHNFWLVNMGGPTNAMLPVSEAVREYVDFSTDITRFYDINENLIATVTNVSRDGFVRLSTRGPGLRKLAGGRIIKITPSKVPRVIGTKGSMINMIKELTKTEIVVGQNGWIWIKGEPKDELAAMKAIYKIDKESHIKGLTNRVEDMLKGDEVGSS